MNERQTVDGRRDRREGVQAVDLSAVVGLAVPLLLVAGGWALGWTWGDAHGRREGHRRGRRDGYRLGARAGWDSGRAWGRAEAAGNDAEAWEVGVQRVYERQLLEARVQGMRDMMRRLREEHFEGAEW